MCGCSGSQQAGSGSGSTQQGGNGFGPTSPDYFWNGAQAAPVVEQPVETASNQPVPAETT